MSCYACTWNLRSHQHTCEPCNVCGTSEEPTFEAGGLWWCAGCAKAITDAHVEEDRDHATAPPETP